jgi:hypothetical protein
VAEAVATRLAKAGASRHTGSPRLERWARAHDVVRCADMAAGEEEPDGGHEA